MVSASCRCSTANWPSANGRLALSQKAKPRGSAIVTNFTSAAVSYTHLTLPTILSLIDVEPITDRPIDGISLVPLFDGKLAKRGRPIGFESKGQTAWIGDRYKLYSSGKAKGSPQLFDLIADPSEKQDLAKCEPGLAKRLAKELAAWRESCRASATGNDY